MATFPSTADPRAFPSRPATTDARGADHPVLVPRRRGEREHLLRAFHAELYRLETLASRPECVLTRSVLALPDDSVAA
ncbi:MAG TPA: hypothetical protein VK081_07280 [Planctomycetota bacterium]|nr:hypothetical protein [Planctomycetota bacterium]